MSNDTPVQELGFFAKAKAWIVTKLQWFANFLDSKTVLICSAVAAVVLHLLAHMTSWPLVAGLYTFAFVVALASALVMLWKNWRIIAMFFSSKAKTVGDSVLDQANVSSNT
jgi:hypothetical protein